MKNKILLGDKYFDYEIIYRNVKNPRIELKTGSIVLISPTNFKNHELILKKHEKWLINKLKLINYVKYDDLILNRDFEELVTLVENYLKLYSYKYGLKHNTLKFRRMKVRWGSCDNLGNIKFNSKMKFLPNDLIKYVVFHEFSHLTVLSHNKEFKKLISNEFPNYKYLDEKLSAYWFTIQKLD